MMFEIKAFYGQMGQIIQAMINTIVVHWKLSSSFTAVLSFPSMHVTVAIS